MTLQFLQKKKHIFKKRYNKSFFKKKKIKYGKLGLEVLKSIRYEFVYLRFLKKLFKQKHMRRKMSFKRSKFWIFLNINYILTNKSTNSRMGAGIGSIVRVAIILKRWSIFLECKGYSSSWLKKIYKKLRFKYPFKFNVIYCRHCTFTTI